ncbi:DUF434 domain-containing protein [Stygiolobus caldivivus]|uniref:DUF434 domain-containing protein n=1 Tax=Stygiolobus caldivivus TaxID=2824673 RepID=A0A8D5U7V6_9CREN|nr:DUF434 domain-containing protein [Stygiolobus caldivivus]BCU70812.1 hypothetical protein KN1_21090 [Stygiolobus caldivivus]
MLSNQLLQRAYEDYKFLINRGYNRKPALDLVSARYGLSKKERLLLYRCTHTDEEVEAIRQKKVEAPEEVMVDGYNISLTLLSAIYNDDVFICDDGLVRDLGLGKRKEKDEVFDSIVLIAEFLSFKRVAFQIVLDAQVSKSGELSNKLRKIGVNAITAKKADMEVIVSGKVVVSNDFVVVMKANKVYDLLGDILKISSIKVPCFPPNPKNL